MANKISGRARIESEAEKLTEPVALKHGVRIYDVEYVKEGSDYYLRIYADKEGGFTVDDCEAVSRRIDPLLDREDFIAEPYTLEVSSPGLGRVLRRPHDFEYAKGREVEAKLYRAVGKKKTVTGILLDADDRQVKIRPSDGGEDLIIGKSEIARISLTYEL